MGVFGPALFSDDVSLDVRDRYLLLVGDGLEGSQATDRLMAEWETGLDDPESAAVFWLALAATQSRCGRLEERVTARALTVMDTGADLSRWHQQARLLARRKTALERLRRSESQNAF